MRIEVLTRAFTRVPLLPRDHYLPWKALKIVILSSTSSTPICSTKPPTQLGT